MKVITASTVSTASKADPLRKLFVAFDEPYEMLDSGAHDVRDAQVQLLPLWRRIGFVFLVGTRSWNLDQLWIIMALA
jgi:hypothetical protein